jgi:serine/threonine protein phosphatase 1
MLTAPLIQRFERNTAGRDWAVGDIHGCFAKLRNALEQVGFDPRRDRLFSVGDLIDRGPECRASIKWLDQPWFHAVQGNHEDYAIRYMRTGKVDPTNWRINGGGWFLTMPAEEQHIYAEAFAQLPFAIEVQTEHGLVGLVHADCPVRDWSRMEAALQARGKRARAVCQWSRDRLARNDTTGVQGVRAVIVGHTPVRKPVTLGNVYHIDTAGWQPEGYFTLLDLATLTAAPVEAEAPALS